MTRIIDDEFASLLTRAFGDLPPGTYTATTAAAASAKPPTITDLQAMVDAMDAFAAAEPIRAWMAKQGKSPDDGYVLVLPRHMAQPYLPSYVRVSSMCSVPMLLLDPMRGLPCGPPKF